MNVYLNRAEFFLILFIYASVVVVNFCSNVFGAKYLNGLIDIAVFLLFLYTIIICIIQEILTIMINRLHV